MPSSCVKEYGTFVPGIEGGSSLLKKILFVCATGGITSTVAENHIIEACKKGGVDVKTIRCSAPEVRSFVDDVDFIVSTAAIGNNYPKPVVDGLPFLTGIGRDELIEKIVELAKQETTE